MIVLVHGVFVLIFVEVRAYCSFVTEPGNKAGLEQAERT